MDILPVCMCRYHTLAWCLQRTEEELEFQMVVSYHVGAGIEPRFSERASALNH